MNSVVFFYSGIEPILRIIVVGSLTYLCLITIFRIVGQRTLAQMRTFDFIISVTIGSTYGRVITARGTSLLEGVTALLVLVGMQYTLAWSTVKFPKVGKLFNDEPVLLYFQGQFLDKAMKKHRITRQDLFTVIRQAQVSSLQGVEAIVLESSGQFSVVKIPPDYDNNDNSALEELL